MPTGGIPGASALFSVACVRKARLIIKADLLQILSIRKLFVYSYTTTSFYFDIIVLVYATSFSSVGGLLSRVLRMIVIGLTHRFESTVIRLTYEQQIFDSISSLLPTHLFRSRDVLY